MQVDWFWEKGAFDMRAYPNFAIGRLPDGTYVGVLDKDYMKPVTTGSSITVVPEEWSDLDKEQLKPLFVINRKASQNNLYCKVRLVLYGRIR
jgi:hypothetical protein